MPIILRNTAERIPLEYEGITVYYHRLTYLEQTRLTEKHRNMGQFDAVLFLQEAAQLAVDGWSEHLYGADMQIIPVPSHGDPDEKRAAIAAIVEHFPPSLIRQLGESATEETPDFLRKSWQKKWDDSSSSSTNEASERTPVATVDGTELTIA